MSRVESESSNHLRVVPLPGRTSGLVVVPRALAETAVLLALGGEAAGLAVLVHGVGDPVDAGVTADGLVLGAVSRSER